MVNIIETDDAANGRSTQYEMSVGDTFSGSIWGSGTDHDWVEITLVAGQTYTFSVDGTSLNDPNLRIRDSAGVSIEFDDDSGPGLDPEITFTANASGAYYLDIGSYSNRTGSYTLNAEINSPLNALRWGDASFSQTSIDVFFALDNTTVNDDGSTLISDGFTSAQIASIMEIFGDVESFTNLTFNRTYSQESADIELATSDLGSSLFGYMYTQGSSSNDGLGVFTSNPEYWTTESTRAGGFMYGTIVHEIGHGLGLAHTHDTGGGSGIMEGVSYSGDTGDYGLNEGIYTVMSYNDGWSGHNLGSPGYDDLGYSSGFAALDIAVLQEYYGANTTHNSGGNSYFIGGTEAYSTIWDTGGIDAIRVIGSSAAHIDLRSATLNYEVGGGGYLSYTEGLRGGFTIANGVLVENAFGGDGSDTIQGNYAANRLIGNAGSDTIYGGAGNDYIQGNDGHDTLFGGNGNDKLFGGAGNNILDGGSGNDQITGGASGDTIIGGTGIDKLVYWSNGTRIIVDLMDDSLNAGYASGDVITGVEQVIGNANNDSISGDEANNKLVGNNGHDYLNGRDGNDSLWGGNGNDSLYGGNNNDRLDGGNGNDFLSGGLGVDNLIGRDGNDRLVGGSGNDRFHFYAGDDTDTIVDFVDDEDTLVLHGFGFTNVEDALQYASLVNNASNDLRFDFDSGDSIIIIGGESLNLLNDITIV